jgi:protein tyrosine/serine phosphatase
VITDRWVPLGNALNLRDLGGLPCAGGGRVRSRVLLRGGSLSHLTSEDAGVLVAHHGVDTVLDLRTAAEIGMERPSALARAGVATAHLPLLTEERFALPEAAVRPDDDVTAVLAGAYRGYLDERGRHVVTAARLVATGDGATVVHCAAGKDRTGVLVAVLLDAVGVDRDAVLDDYEATNERIEQIVARLSVSPVHAAQIASVPLDRHRARPEAMAAVLDGLDEQHGGAAGWLRAHGLDDDTLASLRARLVGPAPS